MLLPALLTVAATDSHVRQWRAHIRQDLFVPASLPELKPEQHSTFELKPGIVAERMTQ
jgi:hypothetical protein